MHTLHVVIDTDKNLFLLPYLKNEYILGHHFPAFLATQYFLVTLFLNYSAYLELLWTSQNLNFAIF